MDLMPLMVKKNTLFIECFFFNFNIQILGSHKS